MARTSGLDLEFLRICADVHAAGALQVATLSNPNHGQRSLTGTQTYIEKQHHWL